MPRPRTSIGQGIPGGADGLPGLPPAGSPDSLPTLPPVGAGSLPTLGLGPAARRRVASSHPSVQAARGRLHQALKEYTSPGGGTMTPEYVNRVQYYVNQGRSLGYAQTVAQREFLHHQLTKYGVSKEQLKQSGIDPDLVLKPGPGFFEQAIHKALGLAYGLGAGFYQVGKAAALDVKAAGAPVGSHDEPTHLLHVGEDIIKQNIHSIMHPGDNPLLTALTVWGIASGGASLFARGAAVRGALQSAETRGLGRLESIKALPKSERHVVEALHKPETYFDPESEDLLKRIANPSSYLKAVLDAHPRLADNREVLLHQAGLKTGRFTKGGRRVGEVVPRTRGETIRDVTKAAVSRPSVPQRVVVIPNDDGMSFSYHPVGSTAPLTNYLQRLWDARIGDRFGMTQEGAGNLPQRFTARYFSSEANARRNMSRERQIQLDLERASIEPLASYGSQIPGRFFSDKIANSTVPVSLSALKPSHGHLSAGQQYLLYAMSTGKELDHLEMGHANAARFAATDETFGDPGLHDFQRGLNQMAQTAKQDTHFQRALANTRDALRTHSEAIGVTDEERWLHLGERDAWLDAMAAGRRAPTMEQLDRDQLIARGQAVEAKGGFVLPQLTDSSQRINKGKIAVSQFGVRGPQPVSLDEFNPAILKSGAERRDVTNLAYQQGRMGVDIKQAEQGFAKLLEMSTAEPKSASDIPIRSDAKVTPELRAYIKSVLPGKIDPEELANLSQHMVQQLAEFYFPRAPKGKVRYIDKRLLDAFHDQHLPMQGMAGHAWDALNAPFRASLLYTKPAYAVNLLQNLATGTTNQGWWLWPNMLKAMKIGEHLGPENAQKVLTLSGGGLSHSFRTATGKGAVNRGIDAAAELWNHVIDKFPRISSWIHEARRAGFDTAGLQDMLLNDPALRDELIHVTRRANREMIDFGGMNHFERDKLRRILFFYPWMRAATLWSMRFPLEHPLQAALYGQVGQYGSTELEKYGHLPSWMEGYVPLSPFDRTMPWMSNTSSVNNFATAAEVARTFTGLITGNTPAAAGLANSLGPASTFLYTLLSGQDSLGRPIKTNESRLGAAITQLATLLPPVQFVQRASKGDKGVKPGGLKEAAIAYLGGSTAGGRVNLAKAQEQGEKEYLSTLSRPEQILYKTEQKIAGLPDFARKMQAQGIEMTTEDLQSLEADYRMVAIRDVFFENAAHKANTSVRNLEPVDRLNLTLAFLSHFKLLDPESVAEIKSLLPELDDDSQIAKLEHGLWAQSGLGRIVSQWRFLESHAAPNSRTPGVLPSDAGGASPIEEPMVGP